MVFVVVCEPRCYIYDDFVIQSQVLWCVIVYFSCSICLPHLGCTYASSLCWKYINSNDSCWADHSNTCESISAVSTTIPAWGKATVPVNKQYWEKKVAWLSNWIPLKMAWYSLQIHRHYIADKGFSLEGTIRLVKSKVNGRSAFNLYHHAMATGEKWQRGTSPTESANWSPTSWKLFTSRCSVGTLFTLFYFSPCISLHQHVFAALPKQSLSFLRTACANRVYVSDSRRVQVRQSVFIFLKLCYGCRKREKQSRDAAVAHCIWERVGGQLCPHSLHLVLYKLSYKLLKMYLL